MMGGKGSGENCSSSEETWAHFKQKNVSNICDYSCLLILRWSKKNTKTMRSNSIALLKAKLRINMINGVIK